MPSNHRSADHEWRRSLKEQPMHLPYRNQKYRSDLHKKVMKARRRNRGRSDFEFISNFMLMILVLYTASAVGAI